MVMMVVVMMIPAIVVIVIAVRAVMMMVMMPPTVMVMTIIADICAGSLACRQWVRSVGFAMSALCPPCLELRTLGISMKSTLGPKADSFNAANGQWRALPNQTRRNMAVLIRLQSLMYGRVEPFGGGRENSPCRYICGVDGDGRIRTSDNRSGHGAGRFGIRP